MRGTIVLLVIATFFTKANGMDPGSAAPISAPLKVAVIDVSPFGEKKGGKITGIHVSYIRQVLTRAHLDFKIQLLPYRRAIKSVQDKSVDLAMFFRQPKLKGAVEIGRAIGFENYIISLRKSPITGLDLKGKTIGVIRAAKYENSFDSDSEIKRIHLENYQQGFKMLVQGRLDGLAISSPALSQLKKSIGNTSNILAPPVLLNKKFNYIYAREDLEPSKIEAIKKANESYRK